MEGNFALHNTFGERKFGKFAENTSEIYSVKHSECSYQGLRCQKLWRQQKMCKFSLNWMVRWYHEFKRLWTIPFDGEKLICECEIGNPCDLQTAAMKNEVSHILQVVGHVLRRISSICSIFIRWGRIIKCTVNGWTLAIAISIAFGGITLFKELLGSGSSLSCIAGVR